MKADATGLRVDVPAQADAALLGAAIMGAASSGDFSSVEEAVAATVTMKKNVSPDGEGKAYFAKKRAVYDKLYNAMIQGVKELQ